MFATASRNTGRSSIKDAGRGGTNHLQADDLAGGKPMRIGILGGTFNPVHRGHVELAKQVCSHLRLDKVLLVPALHPVFKRGQSILDANVRVQKIVDAIKNYPQLDVSDVDIKRGVDTYSIDTVCDLKEMYPNASMFFIAGADVLDTLHQWKDVELLLDMVQFVIVSRPGFSLTPNPHLDQYRDRLTFLNLSTPDISSSVMRAGH